MQTHNISGRKIHYYDNQSSSDEAILFIHGNSHSLNTFRNQYQDSKLNAYRLIGLDLPGHGKSEHSEVYNLDLLADSVRGLVSYLNLKRVIIVGHSLGGHVAIECLDEINPEGVFIFGTPPLTHPLDFGGFMPNDKMNLLSKEVLSEMEIESLLKEYYEDYSLTSVDFEEFNLTDTKFRSLILESFLNLSFKDEVISLNRFKGNKAIIHGNKDKLINPEYIETAINTKELWNNSISYLNSSHNLHIESASEFSEILYSFAADAFSSTDLQLNNKLPESNLCL